MVYWSIIVTLYVLQSVCDRNKIRNNCLRRGISPQNVKIPRVSSANAATLAAQYLLEAFKNPTPNVLFVKINDTHHTALRNFADLLNMMPKEKEQQSTNRHNVRWCEVEK